MRHLIISLFVVGCTPEPEPAGPGTIPARETSPESLPPPVPPTELEITVALVDDPLAFKTSCGDLLASVSETDGDRVLFVEIDDQIAYDAWSEGDVVERSYVLPHPSVTLRAEWGEYAAEARGCDDVLEGKPVVVGSANAVEGTVHVAVDPDPTGNESEPRGTAVIRFDSVSLEQSDGTSADLVDTELTDLFVGWYPG
ncbi:MAG: hypothetical protein AAF211_04120 [Myxococcota bacterium]